jgi:crotonobetainyl-CoA:carnitine CoA-transferase CaiB-like acyl-CoA transferase
MTAVMQGVRILEVAEHTFVPAASALLADWGAEVIKIEPVERGDAMRGLASTGVITELPSDVHVLLEHSNRGKKSLAVDLSTDEGVEIVYKLASTADVFLTNKLPHTRRKLKIDVEHIRGHNPDIIYVTGTGQGELGPDADKGSYDHLAFWSRTGMATGVSRPDYEYVPIQPGPAYGDSIGAMTIAGGIMGALYHRERTAEAAVVDVSLFGVGLWAVGAAVALGLQVGQPWEQPDLVRPNPLAAEYRTKDERWISLTCLQAGRYWAELSEILGHSEWADDERFKDHHSLLSNRAEAASLLREAFAEYPVAEWRERLSGFSGQWVVVQNTIEAAGDPQAVANGYVQDCVSSRGIPFKLVAAPIRFDRESAKPRRAPEFNEDGDEILADLSYDSDSILDLKIRNIIA